MQNDNQSTLDRKAMSRNRGDGSKNDEVKGARRYMKRDIILFNG
jgi:hypothetical protein